MSGIVGIVSPDPEAPRWGRDGLRIMASFAKDETLEVSAGAAWLGACGRPGSFVGAAAPPGSGAPGAGLAAAVCGDLLNISTLRLRLRVADGAGPVEIALAAYRAWGPRLFEHLEGTFVLLLHDADRGVTLAGADPMGVGLLHYARLGDDVLLASEAKAFTAHPRFAARLDEQAFAEMATLGRIMSGRCFFADVRLVAQGCHLEIDQSRVSEVRHWRPADAAGGELRGAAYVDHLAATMEELGGECYSGDGVLLPLTGGLDSRCLAAAAPRRGAARAITFGGPGDDDVRRARQIARVTGMRHDSVPLEEDYVARHAVATVWLGEGRVNPVLNLSGCMMDRFGEARVFLSGLGGDFGRYHFFWEHRLMPCWQVVNADDDQFELYLQRYLPQTGIPLSYLAGLLGSARADDYLAWRRDHLAECLAPTRGLPAMVRMSLYEAREALCHWHGLNVAEHWMGVRTPYLTRRFVEAVLAGHWSETVDDVASLRVIARLDPDVARVPWTLTHLGLRASEPVVRALSHAARLRRSRPLGDGRPLPAASGSVSSGGRLLDAVKRRVYAYGDRRDAWLRDASRAAVTRLLHDSSSVMDGPLDPGAARAMVEAHLAGADLSVGIGQLMNMELWWRLFVDGERPDDLKSSLCDR